MISATNVLYPVNYTRVLLPDCFTAFFIKQYSKNTIPERVDLLIRVDAGVE